MKFLHPFTLLFLLSTAPAAAQVTISDEGSFVITNNSFVHLEDQDFTVKDGGNLTLRDGAGYLLAGNVTGEAGSTLIVRGLIEWTDELALRGETVFQLAGPPVNDGYGRFTFVGDGSEGSFSGRAIVENTVTTELINGYDPVENVSFRVVSGQSYVGAITDPRLPGPGWAYQADNASLFAELDFISLPVEWLSFTGRWNGESARLHWQTANEDGAAFFAVQRQNTAGAWAQIGTVVATGNSSTVSNYEFEDQELGSTKTVFYRLRQVDLDGSESYSDVISLTRSVSETAPSVFPNPARDHVFVDGLNPGAFLITDATGREVVRGVITDGARFRLDLPAGMTNGIYFLRSEMGHAIKFSVSR
ncbi:T9SS type A sorting domain-containing protein [Neolewinella antarctica]|uniref:Secretion system C-terminal sorting domain-containing protein n=1 Tax=Neolewinella antarctica TaxID=442734 RepID=A0ABX0X8Q0_9BACT|nr:T9SS type A sorting domain-containing protein [Neolewinella antarctica]NJC25319.1 hypothetical protein [Neolewinella antarctica]